MRCVAIGSSAEAGSSISSTFGRTASARAMHSRCCCPPESAMRRLVQPVLHFVPDRRGSQALLDALDQLALRLDQAVDAQAVRDVLEDRLRERVRLLEHHPDAPPQPDDVEARVVDVDAVDEHGALDARARDDVVHPVQRAEERALAAARRADERRDEIRAELDRDVVQRLLRAVVEVHAADVDLDRRPAAVGSDGRVCFASAGIAGAGVVLITCASVGGHPEQRTLMAGHTKSHGVRATWPNGMPRPVSPRFQRCKFRG